MSDPWSKFTSRLSPDVEARLEAAEAAEGRPAEVAFVAPAPAPPATPALATLDESDDYPIPIGADFELEWYTIHITPLMRSSLWRRADHQAIGVSLMMWTAAMREDPIGTLPDDDVELAAITGFGRDVAGWREVRARGVLDKWEPRFCARVGGQPETVRLAHPFLTSVALDAFKRMEKQAAERRRAAERAHMSRIKAHMKDGGAHAGMVNRPDIVAAVIECLSARDMPANAANVFEAMQAVSMAETGVIAMRRRE